MGDEKSNNKKMSNHVEEYFEKAVKSSENIAGKQLFSGDEDNIDFKTDIDEEEIRNITSLYMNDKYLNDVGLNPVFKRYYSKFMRLVVSKNRQSRSEYVSINKNDHTDETIDQLSNLSNLTGGRK